MRRPAHRPASIQVTIASRLFPPEAGAAAYRLGALARALTDRGANVDVVTTRPPPNTRIPADPPAVHVSRWPALRDQGGNVRGYVQFASFDGPLMLRLLARRRPNVVVVEPPPTTGTVVRLACAVRRVPYVYYAGDISSTAAAGMGVHPRVVRVLRRVEAFALRGAVVVLAVSEGVAEEVQRLTGGQVPVTVVGTGVDMEVFAPVPNAVDAAAAGPRTIVYAGTMSELHGASVFVKAFSQVTDEFPDARLIFFGQGTEEKELSALADRLAPGRVDFRGLVPGSTVAGALSGACAGLASLHPDVGYDYAFPTKMFAATACGAPVVYAGPGPGFAMVVEHGLGWACRWDVDEVATALRTALMTPPTREQRARLTAWTLEHASQRAVATVAAEAVVSAGRPRP